MNRSISTPSEPRIIAILLTGVTRMRSMNPERRRLMMPNPANPAPKIAIITISPGVKMLYAPPLGKPGTPTRFLSNGAKSSM
jgi:hypothetical protein